MAVVGSPLSSKAQSEAARSLDAASYLPSSNDAGEPGAAIDWFDALMQRPMRFARATLIERFEREYVSRLLASCNQNVAEAARRSGVDRATLFRIIRRGRLREG